MRGRILAAGALVTAVAALVGPGPSTATGAGRVVPVGLLGPGVVTPGVDGRVPRVP